MAGGETTIRSIEAWPAENNNRATVIVADGPFAGSLRCANRERSEADSSRTWMNRPYDPNRSRGWRHSRNGKYGTFSPRADRPHSGLIWAARMTLPHFSVSSALLAGKSAQLTGKNGQLCDLAASGCRSAICWPVLQCVHFLKCPRGQHRRPRAAARAMIARGETRCVLRSFLLCKCPFLAPARAAFTIRSR
jgi:hypothetical protein